MTIYTYNLIKDPRIVDKISDYNVLSPVDLTGSGDVSA